MALLPSIALDLGDRHALRTKLAKRGAHLVKLERLDDRSNEVSRDLRRSIFVSFALGSIGPSHGGRPNKWAGGTVDRIDRHNAITGEPRKLPTSGIRCGLNCP
jgi:hypothetical protein